MDVERRSDGPREGGVRDLHQTMDGRVEQREDRPWPSLGGAASACITGSPSRPTRDHVFEGWRRSTRRKFPVDRPRASSCHGFGVWSYLVKNCEELALLGLVRPLVRAGDDRGVALDQPPRIRRQPPVGPAKLLCGPLDCTSVETLGVALGNLVLTSRIIALERKSSQRFPCRKIPAAVITFSPYSP